MVNKNVFDKQCITYSQINLIFNVRIFFRRFTTWIRAYIISRYEGVGTEEELFGRLYLESTDFGDIFHVIFGRDISNHFALLLNQFTFALRDILSAQLSGNSTAVNEGVRNLYRNKDDIVAFLASVTPYFDKDEWNQMLTAYLQGTLEEANSFASGAYEKDIEIFDRLTALSDIMGYAFAQALYGYMESGGTAADSTPQQGRQCVTLEQMNEIFNIRMFWFELAIWVRSFMLSKFRKIGDENDVYARLQQVPVDYINSLRRVFGDNPVLDTYQLQLNAYVDLIDSLTTAQMNGDTAQENRITQLLYQNANERAASITSLNPSAWNQNEWQARLYDNLSSTIEESTTFLEGDYARNLDVFSTLLDQAESTSGYLAQGVINYIESQRR